MADYTGLLPTQSEVIVDQRGIITRKFRDFLAELATTSSNAALQAEIDALDGRVAALESAGGNLATFVDGLGISIIGQITDPIIRISLNAYLGDLLNVDDVTVPPVDGDALVYDATLAVWKPGSVDSAVPYFIPDGTTYTVPLYKQALFTMPIDVEGSLVVDGFLIEVG